MRFPIITKNAPWVEFENLSGAMIESLADMQILDSETRKPNQDYFDLPIEEGPLLGLMQELFDLTPKCHAGCTTDLRPPSFVFSVKRGEENTSEGEYNLRYVRKLKLNAFLENDSFRSCSGARNLLALSEAYNNRQNCYETIIMLCSTRDGNLNIALDFDGRFLSKIGGYWNFDDEHPWFKSPIYGTQTPFLHVGNNTKIAKVSRAYSAREEELKDDKPPQFYGHKLSKLGYSVADVVFGVLELGGKVFGLKTPLTEARVVQVCESYGLPPSNFDYLAEWRLEESLGAHGCMS